MKPIDINTTYNRIVEKLNAANKTDVITALNSSGTGAVTGSEGLMLTGSFLLSLRDNDPMTFTFIKEEVNEYLEYCRQNGLIL